MMAVEKFSAEDGRFLLEEFGLTVDDVRKMNIEEVNKLRYECFEIEADEAMEADGGEGDLSERGETAVRLVDLLLEVKRGLRFAAKELTA